MMLSLGTCQLPMAVHCTPHLQGSHLLCKLLEPLLHCTFISSPGPNAWFILQVVFAALRSILNRNKKTDQGAFCVSSFPQSEIKINKQQVTSHQQKNIKQEMCIKMTYDITIFKNVFQYQTAKCKNWDSFCTNLIHAHQNRNITTHILE